MRSLHPCHCAYMWQPLKGHIHFHSNSLGSRIQASSTLVWNTSKWVWREGLGAPLTVKWTWTSTKLCSTHSCRSFARFPFYHFILYMLRQRFSALFRRPPERWSRITASRSWKMLETNKSKSPRPLSFKDNSHPKVTHLVSRKTRVRAQAPRAGFCMQTERKRTRTCFRACGLEGYAAGFLCFAVVCIAVPPSLRGRKTKTPPWLPEAVDSTRLCVYYVFSYTYSYDGLIYKLDEERN